MTIQKEEKETIIVSTSLKKVHQEKLQELANTKYPTIPRNQSSYVRDLLLEHLLEKFPELNLSGKEEEDVSR